MGAYDSLKLAILQCLSSYQGGHWRGLTTYVTHFVRNCVVCQANKPEHVGSPGLLQPLPIP